LAITTLQCSVSTAVLQGAPWNLLDGAKVVAKVRAKNARGDGNFSPAAGEGLIPKLPDIPTSLTTMISGRNVYISWKEPKNNGSPITNYLVEIRNK